MRRVRSICRFRWRGGRHDRCADIPLRNRGTMSRLLTVSSGLPRRGLRRGSGSRIYLSANAPFSGFATSIMRKRTSPAPTCPAKSVSRTSFTPVSIAMQVAQRFAPWKQSTSTQSSCGLSAAVFPAGPCPQATNAAAAASNNNLFMADHFVSNPRTSASDNFRPWATTRPSTTNAGRFITL